MKKHVLIAFVCLFGLTNANPAEMPAQAPEVELPTSQKNIGLNIPQALVTSLVGICMVLYAQEFTECYKSVFKKQQDNPTVETQNSALSNIQMITEANRLAMEKTQATLNSYFQRVQAPLGQISQINTTLTQIAPLLSQVISSGFTPVTPVEVKNS